MWNTGAWEFLPVNFRLDCFALEQREHFLLYGTCIDVLRLGYNVLRVCCYPPPPPHTHSPLPHALSSEWVRTYPWVSSHRQCTPLTFLLHTQQMSLPQICHHTYRVSRQTVLVPGKIRTFLSPIWKVINTCSMLLLVAISAAGRCWLLLSF